MSGSFLTHHFVIAPKPRPAIRTAAIVPRRGPSQETASSVWTRIRVFWRRHRSRVTLASLDAHLLRDIGVTYAEAENEANKPFWRG